MQSFKTFRLFFTGLALLFFINACKDPDNVGLDVLPASDLSSLSTIDTLTLSTSGVREDSVPATGNAANLLGAINDNVFGNSNASFYAQVLLTGGSNITFGTNPLLDSIVLTLDYSGYYGDTTSTHNFTVYEMDESILTDSSYYSNKTFAVKPTPLGTLTTSDIHPTDSVLLGTVKTDPHLRIKLDNTFGTTLLTTPSTNLIDNTTFLNYFKGIYVSDAVSSGSGSILYFGPTEAMTKLSLFYKNDEGDSIYNFSINGIGRINHFTHDYSTAVFGNNFNDPAFGSNLCYVQSTSGVKTKIEIPYLTNLNSNGNIAINKAELIITVDNTSTSTYAAHPNLFLVGIDSAAKSYFLPDFIDSQSSFGGTLTSGTYTFILTRYIQQILTGVRKDYGLFLVASGASVNANRTVIGGSNNATSKMKLRLTYTHLNP